MVVCLGIIILTRGQNERTCTDVLDTGACLCLLSLLVRLYLMPCQVYAVKPQDKHTVDLLWDKNGGTGLL